MAAADPTPTAERGTCRTVEQAREPGRSACSVLLSFHIEATT